MSTQKRNLRTFGYLPDIEDARDYQFQNTHVTKAKKELPKVGDILLPHIPAKINQLNIGMCTGAGTSRALKTRMNFLNVKWPFMPSALWIYAYARTIAGTAVTNDSGAYIRDVFKVLNSMGVCPEDSNPAWSWPFSASDGRWAEMPPEPCIKAAALHKCVRYLRLANDENQIKTALADGMPIVIGMMLNESFESKKTRETGIIQKPGWFDPIIGGHCMYAFGYDNFKKNHVDLVNSWGSTWGNKGLCHVPMSMLTNKDITLDLWAVDFLT